MKKTKIELENLSAAKGNSKGEINLQWDPIKNAVSYVIEYFRGDDSKEIKWKIADITSDTRYTVNNLRSNKNYLFRIKSADAKGRMSESVLVEKRAP